jgi:tetratricopeptide (TPR) repeat protein
MVAVGVVGWAVAKPYVLARKTASIHEPDPRAQQFAAEGERAMSDGNLESAQEAFDKASALAEGDPRVLLDEARVEAAKADIFWLKLRLLSPDSVEEMRATKQQLDERIARARKAAGDAVASARGDVSATRAAIDALRLAGATEEARSSVGKIISQSSQPETAYVLAALDLVEPSPSWPTVIDRLRLAAGGEGNGGRARAALVYALARSGDAADARAELAKLESLPRPYPLLPHLRGFLERSAAKPMGSGAGMAVNLAPTGAREATPPRAPPQAPAAGGGRIGQNADVARGGDATGGGMRAAARAIRAGDWDRARQIYEALVVRNPNDSEALSGIADVERAQGNVRGAIASYRRALSVNPSYLPALLGVADTEWGSGDRTNAQLTYNELVERFPEGTYPSYVKIRAAAEADRPTARSATAITSVDAGASVDPDQP